MAALTPFEANSKCLRMASSEITGPIKAKIHVDWSDGRIKMCINGPGHMKKMLKSLKTLFLRNLWTDFNESWYEASGTQCQGYLFPRPTKKKTLR